MKHYLFIGFLFYPILNIRFPRDIWLPFDSVSARTALNISYVHYFILDK